MEEIKLNIDNKKFIPSFGRSRSRKISDQKIFDFNNLSKKYFISDLSDIKNYYDIYYEIGSGYGDFIINNAKKYSDRLYIASDIYFNSTLYIMKEIQKYQLNNIKIFYGDARIFLSSIDDISLNKIYINNPDPWPKRKHFKRRIINKEFLTLLYNKIINNGQLIITTDDIDYLIWSLSYILRSDFKIIINDRFLSDFSKEWIKSKYQRKAEKEGRENYIIKANK